MITLKFELRNGVLYAYVDSIKQVSIMGTQTFNN